MENKRNSKFFLEGLLGLLSAFGPFVMDMYLASFPEITDFYKTSPSLVQLSLAVCTVGLACGQLIFGAISDSYGRKRPLLISLLFYVLFSIGCIVAPSIGFFVVMRFFQGLSAAGGVVISRSIVADCYSGSDLAKMFGVIGLINGISTVVAPMFGGFVAEHWQWQAVFILLLLIGLIMLIASWRLRESLPAEERTQFNPSALAHEVGSVIRNRAFSAASLQYGLVMAVIFTNLASGPFIMNHYGLSAEGISIVFGVNAIALGISSAVSSRFKDLKKVVRYADLGMLIFSIILAVVLVLRLNFCLYELSVFAVYLFVGALCTSTTTLAMSAERSNAGVASALFGAIGFVAGGVVTPFVGLGDIFVTSSALFVLASLGAWLLARKTIK